jgi:hypothetical protein
MRHRAGYGLRTDWRVDAPEPLGRVGARLEKRSARHSGQDTAAFLSPALLQSFLCPLRQMLVVGHDILQHARGLREAVWTSAAVYRWRVRMHNIQRRQYSEVRLQRNYDDHCGTLLDGSEPFTLVVGALELRDVWSQATPWNITEFQARSLVRWGRTSRCWRARLGLLLIITPTPAMSDNPPYQKPESGHGRR